MTSQPRPARDPNAALANMETPRVNWKILAQIGAAFALIWALSLGLIPWVGYWGVGAAGVLTAVAAGFGIYVLRMFRRSRAMVDILKTATDEPGRKAALERLEAAGNKDALNALARARLVAQTDPNQAMSILEAVALKKEPAPIQNEVRANLAMFYLMHNRVRDARALADDIKFDKSAEPKSRGLYAAVVAEAQARTGKADEAKKLLETYSADDPAYGEAGMLLLRAQVYTFMATKNRGLAHKAMEKLAAIDPNMVAVFAVKSTDPNLQKMAKQLLTKSGAIPRPKMIVQRR